MKQKNRTILYCLLILPIVAIAVIAIVENLKQQRIANKIRLEELANQALANQPSVQLPYQRTFALGGVGYANMLTHECIYLETIIKTKYPVEGLKAWYEQGDIVEKLYCMAGFYKLAPEEFQARRHEEFWKDQSVEVMSGCLGDYSNAEEILSEIEQGFSSPGNHF